MDDKYFKEQVEKLSIEELKELAFLMLRTRYKTKMRMAKNRAKNKKDTN